MLKLLLLLFILFYSLFFCRESKTETISITKQEAKIYYLEYGRSFYPSKLVNTTEKKAKVDMSWGFYLIVDTDGHFLMVDSGFEDEYYAHRFSLQYFQKPSELIKQLGYNPNQITDIIVTHCHFDHIGGIVAFPNAKVYLQKSEYDFFLKSEEYSRYRKYVELISSKKQLVLLDGNHTLYNRYYIEKISGHTPGSQVVRFQKYVFTGDECYFQNACYQKIPLPSLSAHSVDANKKFLNSISVQEKILTLHDPFYLENGKRTNLIATVLLDK